MTFIEVKGASDEPAWLKVDAVEAIEFYEPRGNLRVFTSAGRTYYSIDKPEEFLLKINAQTVAEPETKEKKRG